jgi:hypothetical protein
MFIFVNVGQLDFTLMMNLNRWLNISGLGTKPTILPAERTKSVPKGSSSSLSPPILLVNFYVEDYPLLAKRKLNSDLVGNSKRPKTTNTTNINVSHNTTSSHNPTKDSHNPTKDSHNPTKDSAVGDANDVNSHNSTNSNNQQVASVCNIILTWGSKIEKKTSAQEYSFKHRRKQRN